MAPIEHCPSELKDTKRLFKTSLLFNKLITYLQMRVTLVLQQGTINTLQFPPFFLAVLAASWGEAADQPD